MTPPDTAIDTTPPMTSTVDTALFEFSGSDNASRPEGLTYECQLDGGGYTPCSSPLFYSDLSNGSYAFDVRTIDSAGFVDPTPATYTWIVDVPPPTAIILTSFNETQPIYNVISIMAVIHGAFKKLFQRSSNPSQ